MTSAIQVGEIPALIQERLRQVRHQLFPQRLRLQIHDQGLSVQVLTKGKAPLPPPVQVPLPAGICRQGIPQNGAALGISSGIGCWSWGWSLARSRRSCPGLFANGAL